MSARFEVARVRDGINLDVLSPGTEAMEAFDDDGTMEPGEHVLVIGDPWASAYAVVGTPDELHQFATRLLDLVSGSLPVPSFDAPGPTHVEVGIDQIVPIRKDGQS